MDVNYRRSPIEFVAALALHSHRRDLALYRRNYVSSKTRGLLWYHSRLQSEMVKGFFKAAFNVGAAQAAKSRMADILAEAETATTERKRELLEEAERLQQVAEQLTSGR